MSLTTVAQTLRAGFVAAFASAALFSTTVAAEPEITFRAAHSSTPSSTGHKAFEFLDKELREKTGGRIGLEIFPNSQLGGERELVENIQFGNVDLTFVSSAPVASFAPQFFAFDVPFLFKDREQAYKVLDGDVGKEILASLNDKGMVGLAYWENGFRQLTNNKKEIRSPDDLAGMKMRTMENEVHIAAWRAEGANPAPLAFNELFTALQQGTFDAQEGPINLFYDMKFYEVQKFITKTNHVYSPWPVLINPDVYNRLSDADKKILVEAVNKTTAYQRDLAQKADEKAVEAMKDVTIVELTPEEMTAFSSRMGPVQDMVKKRVGAEIVDAIIAEASK